MGRPVLGHDVATERIGLRVEPEMKEAIKARAGRAGMARYLRGLIERDLANGGHIEPGPLVGQRASEQVRPRTPRVEPPDVEVVPVGDPSCRHWRKTAPDWSGLRTCLACGARL